MSFILDALRKSEHERQRQAGPSLAELPVARPRSRVPLAYGIRGVLLVLNLAAALAVFKSRRDRAPPGTRGGIGDSRADAARAPTPPVTRPAPCRRRRRYHARRWSPPPAAGLAQTQAGAGAPAHAPRRTRSSTSPRRLTWKRRMPRTRTAAARAATGRARRRSPGGPTCHRGRADDRRPAPSATAGLPTLNLDLHVYGPDATKRFVFLNNRRYVEGSSTPEGIKIERITPEGVVLGYRGTHFLLTRRAGRWEDGIHECGDRSGI